MLVCQHSKLNNKPEMLFYACTHHILLWNNHYHISPNTNWKEIWEWCNFPEIRSCLVDFCPWLISKYSSFSFINKKVRSFVGIIVLNHALKLESGAFQSLIVFMRYRNLLNSVTLYRLCVHTKTLRMGQISSKDTLAKQNQFIIFQYFRFVLGYIQGQW